LGPLDVGRWALCLTRAVEFCISPPQSICALCECDSRAYLHCLIGGVWQRGDDPPVRNVNMARLLRWPFSASLSLGFLGWGAISSV
jgi:hypothetical protein